MSARRIVLAILLASVATSAFAQSVEYYHLDALGSVRAVSNESGVVTERHDYLPFGEECTTGACAANASLPGSQPRQFTGQERDTETGMDYFGARYYSGKRARFTTVDPDAGIETALVDPQRWNRYSYVGNRPTKVVDPDGRGWLAVAAKLAKAAWTGQDYYSAVSTIVESTGTVFSGDARVGTTDRLWATGSLLLELSSVADVAKGTKSVLGAVDGPYKRPSGATTRAQRESVQGKPCVDCGAIAERQNAGHKKALVVEYYETGSIDKKRMRDLDAVQPHCPTCSNREGAELSRFSIEQRKKLSQ